MLREISLWSDCQDELRCRLPGHGIIVVFWGSFINWFFPLNLYLNVFFFTCLMIIALIVLSVYLDVVTVVFLAWLEVILSAFADNFAL